MGIQSRHSTLSNSTLNINDHSVQSDRIILTAKIHEFLESGFEPLNSMNQRSDKFEFLILITVQFNSRFIQKFQKIQVYLTALVSAEIVPRRT
jgi:hypothetical protein